jgi:serine-type D-Ala-D-Ala carboxypeptidase/endopeptidase (penicillin-binding protein 4)
MKSIILFFSLILQTQLAFSEASHWQDKTEKLISSVLSEVGTSKDHFGIWIQNKNNVAQLNGDKLFVPASLSKIPTALTYANEKSMDEYFHTWVYKVGEIKNGELNGDIYLKGGGDPSFVSESMWLLIQELKRSDIKKIKGQLYVDETYFDSDYYSQGRQTKRVDRAYDAPVSALSFNWNAISIFIRPGKNIGDPARIYTDPENSLIKIVNKTKTVMSHKDSLQVDRSLNKNEIILTVKGSISQNTTEKAFYKSIGDAALWTGANFKEFLNRSGIEYEGDVKKQKVPSNADQLVEFDSWDMARVLAALSKFSNNFVAEMLTKHLGKSQDKQGNIDDGLKKITDFLAKKGWKNS